MFNFDNKIPGNPVNFKNKTVLLTGASSGIGYELAKLIANEGCRLAVIARRKELLDRLADELKNVHSTILPLKCDVSNKAQVIAAYEEVKSHLGDIDIAILNSGVSFRSSIEKLSSKNAEDTFNVNVMGLVYFAEVLFLDFKRKNDGILVGVSSLADSRGFPKSGFYCSSKAAATILLESWRVELKKCNVKVITVKPGFVKTPMTDKNEFKMPFLMSVEKAAHIIFNGIQKEKRIIQFPFLTVFGAKLLKVMPDSLFEFIAKRSAGK